MATWLDSFPHRQYPQHQLESNINLQHSSRLAIQLDRVLQLSWYTGLSRMELSQDAVNDAKLTNLQNSLQVGNPFDYPP